MKLILVSFILFTVVVGYSQNAEIPKKEFSLLLPGEPVTLARGENKNVDIRILKSKAYQKGKVKMGLSSTLPSGVTLSFNPEKSEADLTQAIITAQHNATPGEYSIIVNATINYKTKGSILKILVE